MDDEDLFELCGLAPENIDAIVVEENDDLSCDTKVGVGNIPSFLDNMESCILLLGIEESPLPAVDENYRAELEISKMASFLKEGKYLDVLCSHPAHKIFSVHENSIKTSKEVVEPEDLDDFPIRFKSVFDEPKPRSHNESMKDTGSLSPNTNLQKQKKKGMWKPADASFENILLEHVIDFVVSPVDSIFGGASDRATTLRAAAIMFVGIASFNLFLQGNYTGPAVEEIENLSDQPLFCYLKKEWLELEIKSNVLEKLVVDGEDVHRHCIEPLFLLVARSLLWAVTQPQFASWQTPLTVTKGDTNRDEPQDYTVSVGERSKNQKMQQIPSIYMSAIKSLKFANVWAGRAVVAHERLLNVARGEYSSTLWEEARSLYAPVLETYKDQSGKLAAAIHLEWGLAKHHFDLEDKGKAMFASAQNASGLRAVLTGALGKRTKYQKNPLAQMVVLAASQSTDQMDSQHVMETLDENTVQIGGEIIPNSAKVAAQGVAKIDHGKDGILLENIRFTEQIGAEIERSDEVANESNRYEKEGMTSDGNLEQIDQCILLAFCLDVANSNPKSGLTSEQMQPYLDRVLQNPNNWMIYSTGLLERSWLEFERHHARERAVLQMQALVDQHSNRLSLTQSTTRSVEESAPVQDRLSYIHQIVYPPRWELKKDMAFKYASLGIYGSAAAVFEELEMWEEVVECYTQMGQTQRAKQVVEAQLKANATPAMWAALGNLEQKEDHFHKAWDLSNKKYVRAKLALARMVFNRGDLEQAALHYEEGLSLKPLQPQCWFTLGVAYMRLEEWQKGLRAFTQVVTQCSEEGEAWGNMGAIYIHMGKLEEAYSALTEAVKRHQSKWRLWENLLLVQVTLEKWGESMYTMHKLLDLKDTGKQPVDIEALRRIMNGVMSQYLAQSDQNSEVRNDTLYLKELVRLIDRIVSTIKTNADVWGMYADLYRALGKKDKVLDCLMKQCRALTNQSGWEKDEAQASKIAETAHQIVQERLEENTKSGIYSCKMFLNGMAKRLEQSLPTSPSLQNINGDLELLEEKLS